MNLGIVFSIDGEGTEWVWVDMTKIICLWFAMMMIIHFEGWVVKASCSWHMKGNTNQGKEISVAGVTCLRSRKPLLFSLLFFSFSMTPFFPYLRFLERDKAFTLSIIWCWLVSWIIFCLFFQGSIIRRKKYKVLGPLLLAYKKSKTGEFRKDLVGCFVCLFVLIFVDNK